MNTLYVLKGGMKFKFLALTVVIILGFGVGNTAWGEDKTALGGDWNVANNWNPSGIPESWQTILIPTDVTVTASIPVSTGKKITVDGSLNCSSDFSSGSDGMDVGANSSIVIGGNYTIGDGGPVNFGTNAVLDVAGNLIMSGGSILKLGDNVKATIEGDADFRGGTINAGAELRIKGTMEHSQGSFNIYGTVIIDEDFVCTSGNGFRIYPGGRLIIKGNSTFSSLGGVQIEGDLLVNGDLDYSNSFAFTLSDPGLAAVGGDLTIGSTNINIGAKTNLIVLGDLTFNSGGSTIDGSVVVIGEVNVGGSTSGDIANCTGCELADSGCQPACKLEAEIPSEHPIWDVFVGLNTVYFNDIDIVGNGELNDQVIWTSSLIPANCKNKIKVSYFMTISGTGNAVLQYSENGVDWSTGDPVQKNPDIDRYFWEGSDGNGVPIGTGTIFLRILVRNLDAGSTVTFDKILVDAFNEGGVGSTPIQWGTTPDVDVCANQLAVYEIANISDYTDIRWNYPSSPNVEIVSISPNKARCEVKWKNSSGVLKVTAFGGSCGGESASVTYTINVNQPTSFSAFYEKTDISCPTSPNEGSITLNSCGGTGTVSYEWKTGPVGYAFADLTVPTINNLPEGIYTATVYLNQGQPTEESQLLTIEIKRPVLVDVAFDPSTLNAFLCPTDLNAGYFEIIATGGTPPYNITVTKDGSDITNSDNSLVYSNLVVGAYVVSVDDKNNCGVRTFPLSIVVDTENPTFTTFPANVQMTMAEYQANTGSKLTTTTSNLTGETLSASALTSILALPSLSGLHNLKLSFTVSQSPVSANDADVFYVEMTTDGSNWNSILTDQNSLNNGTVTIPLGENADGNTNLGIRFTANITTAGLTYTVSNVQISGSRFAVSPPTCNDNSGNCAPPTFTDSAPIWNGSCKSYVDGEFRIERVWRGEDACGLPVERTQYLSVGTAPEFTLGTFPTNLNLDFCHNEPTVTAPMASDGCGDVTVSWEVRNSANEVVGNGVVTTMGENVTLPALLADAAGDDDLEYTVTWTATDDSHLTYSQNQTITIKPAIAFDYFQIASSENICQNEEVTVNLKPKGGTGVFDHLSSFAPVITSPDVLGATSWEAIGAGVYQCKVQFGATASARTFTITVTDRDGSDVKGDCSASLESAPFDVHDLIPTGGISRD